MGPKPEDKQVKTATVLASVITGVWAISFVVDIVVEDYDPSPTVHALMMMTAGAVFGEGFVKIKKTNESVSKKEEIE